MELGEEIVLRPRFTIDFEVEADQLLRAFEEAKQAKRNIHSPQPLVRHMKAAGDDFLTTF